MSSGMRVRKKQMSIKLPPDIEKKLRDAVDAGEYTNITDAITSMLRSYFESRDITKIQEAVAALQSDVEILKMRNDYLEKKLRETNKNTKH